MVPNFFGKDRIHRKRAIWFQMKPDSPYYVLSGSKNLALFLALLRWYEIKLSNMRWREICITFPCYGTDWHRKRQAKTPFCRFESCTAYQRQKSLVALELQGFCRFWRENEEKTAVLKVERQWKVAKIPRALLKARRIFAFGKVLILAFRICPAKKIVKAYVVNIGKPY